MSRLIWVFLVAAAVTAAATPLAILIAPKIGAMDIPKDNRRMHKKPIPRFGGIAIFLGIAVGFISIAPLSQQTRGLLVGAVMILLLGIVDDLKDISAKVKLAGQIICAGVAWFFTIRILGMANLFGGAYISFSPPVSFIVTVLWIVAITNTINLIDGLDGLAAGITCIACFTIAYSSGLNPLSRTCLLSVSIAGACVGFLVWNMYPAKIFMGDAGSQLLGYLLSTVSLIGDYPTKGTTLFAAIVPMLILALPIFDTMFAIVRRAVSHKPIMKADKGHLHHRIMAMGFGQRRTVLALYCISAIMGIAGILWTSHKRMEALVLTMIAMCLIVVFLGIGLHHKKPEDAAAERAPEASGTEDSK
jgi:UDP-GlcNAc:undecaprenyl-phosphate GlcNAc-1-phosphate transferase